MYIEPDEHKENTMIAIRNAAIVFLVGIIVSLLIVVSILWANRETNPDPDTINPIKTDIIEPTFPTEFQFSGSAGIGSVE